MTRQTMTRTGLLRVAGGGLLLATAAIHLDLYLTGYRTIPTIGVLFLLQVIAAFGLGVTVLVMPGRLALPGRLAAAAGAGFALATLGGCVVLGLMVLVMRWLSPRLAPDPEEVVETPAEALAAASSTAS